MVKNMIRWAIAAFVMSGAVPACAVADAASPDYFMVRRHGAAAPRILAGIIVHATAEDLDRFDDVARLYGIRMERLPDGKEVQSIALFLAQQLRRDAVFDLYRQLQSGALGKLRIEAMIVAPEDIRPGVKPTDIIRVVPADDIDLP